ncbi:MULTISPECIES: hypothetical protein [unclassified Pseudoalteromonas]|uniref:hypothetical protein n=1 Tax=unclassified Pseudoalteromonas TaxID=194690 RepID=UPI00209694DC|nr:hypothetical protein [Pseudoalteromonas sp. XMcav2-N]MCO7187405.1 hypothetical protein [Pseudoalteromonas sp. XMcav2-N]
MKNLFLLFLLSLLPHLCFAVNISDIEKGNVGGIVPITAGGIFVPIPIAFEHNLPPEPQDDGSLGSIDSDNDGVRDDIERYIAQQYPLNRTTRGYLYHAAAYARKIVSAPSSPAQNGMEEGLMVPHQVLYSYLEVQKATYCLNTNNRDQIRYVTAMNMDSKERFTAFMKNTAKVKKLIKISDQGTDCRISNTEPLRPDHPGFHSRTPDDLHGYITDGYGVTAVNKHRKVGMGIDAPKRFTIYNKAGSDGALRIKVWQSDKLIKNTLVARGKFHTFTFIHTMVDNQWFEYEVFKESGETVLFNIKIDPHI